MQSAVMYEERACGPIDWLLDIARMEAPIEYWISCLTKGTQSTEICRALLVASAMNNVQGVGRIRSHADCPDSRLRARVAFALGQIASDSSLDLLKSLACDPSSRVRFQARKSIVKLSGTTDRRILEPVRIPRRGNIVLVSDDLQIIQQSWEFAADRIGLQVVGSSSVCECLDQVDRLVPDLVITDNRKYGSQTGIEMIRTIFDEPTYQDIPIVMISADPIRWQAYWAGADYYRLKPFVGFDEFEELMLEFLYR
jgi:CheY-like chemotaxis protein